MKSSSGGCEGCCWVYFQSESANIVYNLNSALTPRCPPGVAAELCTSIKQSQYSCISKEDAGIALLELLLIVEEDVHNQSTLFWMASHLILWPCLPTCAGSSPALTLLVCLWVKLQHRHSPIPSTYGGAELFSCLRPPERGFSIHGGFCMQDFIYLCCEIPTGQPGMLPSEDFLHFDCFQF